MKDNKINKNLVIICITIVILALFGILYNKDSSVQVINNDASLLSGADEKTDTSKTSGNKTKVSSSKDSADTSKANDDESDLSKDVSEPLIYEDYNVWGNENNISSQSNDNTSAKTELAVVSSDVQEAYTEQYLTKIENLTDKIYSETHITVTVCNYSEKIYQMISTIKNDMSSLDSSFFDGMQAKGYKCKISIADTISGSGFASFTHSGKTLDIQILSSVSNWNIYFMLEFAKACEYMISLQTDINTVYSEFEKLNPDDFTYAQYSAEYVGDTKQTHAFINIISQRSVYDDRINLLAYYMCKGINTECLSHNSYLYIKLERILNDLDTYIG